jgi:hypothetical protein
MRENKSADILHKTLFRVILCFISSNIYLQFVEETRSQSVTKRMKSRHCVSIGVLGLPKENIGPKQKEGIKMEQTRR